MQYLVKRLANLKMLLSLCFIKDYEMDTKEKIYRR